MTTPLSFNANWYLSQNPDVAAAIEAGAPFNAFEHFTLYGRAENRSASPVFDAEEYLRNNPDVAEAVAQGLITAWDHFELFGGAEGRSPTPLFNEAFYLQQNPDVAAAIEQGIISSAAQHFALFGQSEPRAINPAINLGQYINANPDIGQATANGITTPFSHLMEYGVNEGRDLGNGVVLSNFSNDPGFTQALTNGNAAQALTRVESVAPFLPTFERPAGWTPPANTPVPVDFVPPADSGIKLVVPPEVVVPDDVELPDTFEPVEPEPTPDTGGGGGGGDTNPTFTVTESAPGSKIWTLSTQNGNVAVTDDGTNYVFTPATGTAVSKAKVDVTEVVVATITLSGSTSVLATITTITGNVTVSAGTATAAQLLAISSATSGTVNASAITSIDGSLTDIASVVADNGITKPTNFDSTLSAGVATATDLLALSTGNGTGTVNASAITSIDGLAADVASVVADVNITKPVNWAATVSGTTSVANANIIDGANGTGIITATITEGDLTTLKTLTGTDNAYTITVTDTTADIADIIALNGITSVNVGAEAVATITSAATTTIDLTAAGVTWRSGINVTGTGGNDTITGTGGIDTITGGAGADSLTGGLGADTFVYSATAQGGAAQAANAAVAQAVGDTITDFVSGTEIINVAAGTTTAGAAAGAAGAWDLGAAGVYVITGSALNYVQGTTTAADITAAIGNVTAAGAGVVGYVAILDDQGDGSADVAAANDTYSLFEVTTGGVIAGAALGAADTISLVGVINSNTLLATDFIA